MGGIPKKAVILLSGGLDSTTTLAIARTQGFSCYALSVDYGQRQKQELKSARRVARHLGVTEHRIVELDLASLGGSALTTDDICVPKGRAIEKISEEVPATYVPARNTVFLAHALAWAEVLGAFDIFIGANAVDYSGYPDCRPEFIAAFEALANLATSASNKFLVHAPLIHMTKAQIIQEGLKLAIDYSWTHTCYDPVGELACGLCDACVLRRAGFRAAGVEDPLPYADIAPHRRESL